MTIDDLTQLSWVTLQASAAWWNNTNIIAAKTGKQVSIYKVIFSTDTATLVTIKNSAAHTAIITPFDFAADDPKEFEIKATSAKGEGIDLSAATTATMGITLGYRYEDVSVLPR